MTPAQTARTVTAHSTSRRFRALAPAAIAAGALALSACAGGAGGGAGGGSGGGDGFEYGASQEDVDAVLEDLEPITFTFQGGAQSPESQSALSPIVFKEYVEERSGGKITVDIVYAQAVAGYAEVDDALADGRLDGAYTLPIYDPAKYPAFDALSTASYGMPNSPVVGEIVSNAALNEYAWSSDAILGEFEEQMQRPLVPIVSTGNHHAMCTQPAESLDDWKGRQVRIPNTAQDAIVNEIGATPTSMEYVETFEALQRGTIDCTLGQFLPSEEGGLFEVTPYVEYAPEEAALPGRGAGTMVVGSNFDSLPLAYQQIIFDSAESGFDAASMVITNGNAAGVKQLREYGGEMKPLNEEVAAIYRDKAAELSDGVNEAGTLGGDAHADLLSGVEKWQGVAEEMGLEESGDYENLDEWYGEADYDLTDFSAKFYEEVILPHRPS